MKNVNLLKAIPVVASLAAMFCAAPVFAQTHTMGFDIPFQFVAGDRMFPAGHYVVTLNQFSSLVLQSAKENKFYALKLSTDLAQRSHKDVSQALLRFTQHGDTLFLTAAWAPDQYDGKTLAPSPRLLEADRAAAEAGSAGAAPADVYVK